MAKTKLALRIMWKVSEKVVPLRGIEPPTHALRMRCSTPELQRRKTALAAFERTGQ